MKRNVLATLLLISAIAIAAGLNVRIGYASTTIVIEADGSINPPSAPIQRDGNLYTLTDDIFSTIIVERNDVVIEGSARLIQGFESGYGFGLLEVRNVTIQNARISGFAYGIYLNSSTANAIIGNVVFGNVWEGIWLIDSSNNTITENILTENYGGIALLDSSNFNNVYTNDIIGCKNVGMEVYRSMNNTIWGNNFVGNTFQVHNTASTNMWDNGYPIGGNYWGDYTGSDADGDGIGDIAYNINFNNQDRYPLMKTVVIPEHLSLVTMMVLAVAALSISILTKPANFSNEN